MQVNPKVGTCIKVYIVKQSNANQNQIMNACYKLYEDHQASYLQEW